MSFILEALRKSESERRMESAPQVMRVPLAIGRERLPSWVFVLIAALVISLIALAAASWRQFFSPASGPGVTAGSAPAALIENRDMRVKTPAPSSSTREPVTALSDDEPPSEPVESEAPAAETAEVGVDSAAVTAPTAPSPVATSATSATAATTPRPAAAAAAPEPDTSAASLPSAAALRAEGIPLPALDLQLHVYSANRSNRFVLVNGVRYGEGDEIAPGTELVRIAAEGAVLSFRGREFLLGAD
jgi:general secretion pathway protein B